MTLPDPDIFAFDMRLLSVAAALCGRCVARLMTWLSRSVDALREKRV